MNSFAPPRREMPPDVRDRLRRKLWSELDPPGRSRLSRARVPIAAIVGAIVIIVAGSVVFAQNAPIPNHAAAALGSSAFSRGDADLDRCYAMATARHRLPARPLWKAVRTEEVSGVSVTAARVEGKPLFCETTQATVYVSDPNATPVYAYNSSTSVLFATPNGTVAGVVDPQWNGFELRVSAPRAEFLTLEPKLFDGMFIARSQTAIGPDATLVAMYKDQSTYLRAPQPLAFGKDR